MFRCYPNIFDKAYAGRRRLVNDNLMLYHALLLFWDCRDGICAKSFDVSDYCPMALYREIGGQKRRNRKKHKL